MRAFAVLAQTIGVVVAVAAGSAATYLFAQDPRTVDGAQELALLLLAVAAVGLVLALVAREARR